MLEVGDVVRFDKLYNNMKAYGEDYTSDDVYRNGQKIYPFFIITSVTKSTKNIKIECMQLHRLKPEFIAGLGSITRKSQIGISIFPDHLDIIQQLIGGDSSGLYPINGHITLEDIRMLEDIISNNIKYPTDRQLLIADVASDKTIDEYDLYIMSTLFGYALLPENAVLGDINNDGAINVVDVVNLVGYILNTQSSNLNLEALELAADINEDGFINVVDIVNLVNIILGE